MQPHDLIKTAQDLLRSASGKPRQANLLRATSTAYYALFHTLAKCCADTLIGTAKAGRSKHAWKQAYRALNHNSAKKCCTHAEMIRRFPQEIQDFAIVFTSMQEKRHRADYDPYERVYKSSVEIDLQGVQKVIIDFEKSPIKDKRAFAAYVLLVNRS